MGFTRSCTATRELWVRYLRCSIYVLKSSTVAILGVLVFYLRCHVSFYVVDEDVKLTHGFVDAFLVELCRKIRNS
jgi:hypothetical protein